MAVKHINEFDFAQFVQCPLRLATGASYMEPLELQAAKLTANWLLKQSFEDTLPTLGAVRAAFEEMWVRIDGDACPKQVLRLVPKIAKRLHDMAVDYLVLHPVSPYSLSFGRSMVKGAYATLIKAKKTDKPLLLRLRFRCDKGLATKQGPDTVNLLRWLHFRQWEAGLPLVRVLNYSIDDEASWLDFFDERLARNYSNNAASNLAEQRVYPIPGVHCPTCQGQACLSDPAEGKAHG